MAVTIRIPTTLRPLTAGAGEVEVDGSTVGEALASLEASHPGFGSRILDESGALRRFVNVFVSDEDVPLRWDHCHRPGRRRRLSAFRTSPSGKFRRYAAPFLRVWSARPRL